MDRVVVVEPVQSLVHVILTLMKLLRYGRTNHLMVFIMVRDLPTLRVEHLGCCAELLRRSSPIGFRRPRAASVPTVGLDLHLPLGRIGRNLVMTSALVWLVLAVGLGVLLWRFTRKAIGSGRG